MGFGLKTTTIAAGMVLAFGLSQASAADRQMERLTRGVQAVGDRLLIPVTEAVALGLDLDRG